MHAWIVYVGQWIRPVVNGDCPQPCSGFTLTLIGENKAVLFGGYCSGKGRNNFVYIAELTKDSVVSPFIICKLYNLFLRLGQNLLNLMEPHGPKSAVTMPPV